MGEAAGRPVLPLVAGNGRRRLPFRLARGAVLAVSLVLLCRGIATPFNGWHDLNSAMYSLFARNHIQYGLRYTKLYCTWGQTLAPPPVPERYLDHPPLIALWTAVPLALFGDHEWAARLVPIAASVGSTALLMTILTRLGSPLLGVLAGFFFAVLPLTAYFGRMIDHVAPAQFFTLLMVEGYRRWTDGRGGPRSRRTGAALYVLGVVFGIGTAWAVVIGAGLVWAWHGARVLRSRGGARLLLWLAAIPALALTAVVVHIAAGAGGDFGMLRPLFLTRSLGGVGGRQPWSAWLALQGAYFVRNFTLPGALAAAVGVVLLGAGVLRGRSPGAPTRFALTGDLAAVVALFGLHGLLYVVAFKNASWFHDYWQFFFGPFVAASLAAASLLVRASLSSRAPRLGRIALPVLLVAPIPWTARSLDFYARHTIVDPGEVEALKKLRRLVPSRAPAWTSHRWRTGHETLGGYARHWPNPVIAYYADRPLLYTRDVREVVDNAPGCAAYLLTRNPRTREIERALSRRFDSVPAGDRRVIFLLARPRHGGRGS
jgi:Dolichyl-phosphate-mannose-protein mannosyltransferase